jgi:hypothetical protein
MSVVLYPSNPLTPGDSRVRFLTAEASVAAGGRVLAQRSLLRIEHGDRRFELRPTETAAAVSLDIAPGLMHATLVAGDRATLELEWMVGGNTALALDAWALCARNSSEVSILDGLGRAVVADLTARDPSMPPIVIAPGIYLLRAQTANGPLVIRIGQSIAAHGIRAAV